MISVRTMKHIPKSQKIPSLSSNRLEGGLRHFTLDKISSVRSSTLQIRRQKLIH